MNRSSLISSIRAKIDEVSTGSEILVDVSFGEGKNIDILIENILDESALEVLSIAPVHKLSLSVISTDGTGIDNNSGEIKLNSDYLRFVSLKMGDFTRAITQLVPEGSPIEKRQNNPYYRGTVDRPIGVLVVRNDGNYVRYYGVNNNHSSAKLMYIKKDIAENVPASCQQALCWLCASKILAIMGDVNGAKAAESFFTQNISI